jgi:hypothetical protein
MPIIQSTLEHISKKQQILNHLHSGQDARRETLQRFVTAQADAQADRPALPFVSLDPVSNKSHFKYVCVISDLVKHAALLEVFFRESGYLLQLYATLNVLGIDHTLAGALAQAHVEWAVEQNHSWDALKQTFQKLLVEASQKAQNQASKEAH